MFVTNKHKSIFTIRCAAENGHDEIVELSS